MEVMKNNRLLGIVLIAALAAPIAATYAQKSATVSQARAAANASSATKAPSRGNVDYITAARMKDYLAFIASDEL